MIKSFIKSSLELKLCFTENTIKMFFNTFYEYYPKIPIFELKLCFP